MRPPDLEPQPTQGAPPRLPLGYAGSAEKATVTTRVTTADDYYGNDDDAHRGDAGMTAVLEDKALTAIIMKY